MLQQKPTSQAGFTLVELAIVMIIIGLLIAGVLKGQALIANAQVTATVAQIKSTEAAVSTFRDTYSAIPGDLPTPAVRLPGCVGACIQGAGLTNGDGRLANAPNQDPVGAENEAFFPQLSAAGLVTGLQGAAQGTRTVNGNFPGAKISNNVLQASSATGNTIAQFGALIGNGVPDQGLYVTVISAVGAPAAGTVALKPDQAGRLDTKMDDGIPDTGLTRAFGTVGNVANAVNCGTVSGAAPGLYATDTSAAACGLYVHLQN